MSWGKPNKPLVISSSAPALSTRRNPSKLAPIAAASQKVLPGLRGKKAAPPYRARDEASTRRQLDALGTYVIETGCYDMVDAMLQAVLVERPSAALPYLVTFARARERSVLATKLELGKLLSSEEMDLLRGGDAPLDPDSAELLKPVDPAKVQMLSTEEMDTMRWRAIETKLATGQMLSAAEQQLLRVRAVEENLARGKMLSADEVDLLREHAKGQPASEPNSGPVPIGGAWQRRAWESYLGHQQVDKMLQSLMQEILQKQPASPLAFTTRWLEATLEKELVEAKARVAAEKVAQAEREAAEAQAAAELALQMTSKVEVSEKQVLSPGTPLYRVRLDLSEERGEAVANVVITGPHDVLSSSICSLNEPAGAAAAAAGLDEVAALQLKLEQGQILSVGEIRTLRLSAYEQKMEQGQMLTATELLELRELVAEAEADKPETRLPG